MRRVIGASDELAGVPASSKKGWAREKSCRHCEFTVAVQIPQRRTIPPPLLSLPFPRGRNSASLCRFVVSKFLPLSSAAPRRSAGPQKDCTATRA
jgi:hypothetical protein